MIMETPLYHQIRCTVETGWIEAQVTLAIQKTYRDPPLIHLAERPTTLPLG